MVSLIFEAKGMRNRPESLRDGDAFPGRVRQATRTRGHEAMTAGCGVAASGRQRESRGVEQGVGPASGGGTGNGTAER